MPYGYVCIFYSNLLHGGAAKKLEKMVTIVDATGKEKQVSEEKIGKVKLFSYLSANDFTSIDVDAAPPCTEDGKQSWLFSFYDRIPTSRFYFKKARINNE
jgi:hypothetical protein